MDEVTLKVEGLTSAGVLSVGKAVARVPGVAEVAVHLRAGTARVRGAGLDPAMLLAVVRDAGFDAHVP